MSSGLVTTFTCSDHESLGPLECNQNLDSQSLNNSNLSQYDVLLMLFGNRTHIPAQQSDRSNDFERIINLYVIGSLCVFGFCGNILAVVVFRRDRLNHGPLLMLIILAVFDGIHLLVCFLRYTVVAILRESYSSTDGSVLLFELLMTAVTYTTQTFASWVMLPVTVERYLVVCHPFRGAHWCSMRNKLISVTIVITVGVIYNIPRFLDQCLFEFRIRCKNIVVYSIHQRQGLFSSNLYSDLYDRTSYLLVLYLMPLVVLCVLNTKLVRAIKHSRRSHKTLVAVKSDHGETGTARLLVIIVIQFIICQSPVLGLYSLIFIKRSMASWQNHPTYFNILNNMCSLLLVFNSAVNFVLYCVFGSTFRKQLKSLIFPNRPNNNRSTRRTTNETELLHMSVHPQQQNHVTKEMFS